MLGSFDSLIRCIIRLAPVVILLRNYLAVASIESFVVSSDKFIILSVLFMLSVALDRLLDHGRFAYAFQSATLVAWWSCTSLRCMPISVSALVGVVPALTDFFSKSRSTCDGA